MFSDGEDAAFFAHEPTSYDVVIVGAGPVGAAMALLVARHGWSVAIVERQPAPYPLPRAVHFDDESARILQACRLGERLAELSESADTYEWRNAQGETLLRFDTAGKGISGWPVANMFNQPDLEDAINALLVDHPIITMMRGMEATSIVERDDDVLVSLEWTPNSDDAKGPRLGGAVCGTYVIGCDGANSTVRQLLDIPLHDGGEFADWLVVDVALDEPREFSPINLQVCDPQRPTTAVSGGPGRRRWEFLCRPDETLAELNTDDNVWQLLAPWDVTAANATIVRRANYRFHARWATSWSRGRVFLAGDAAHQTPPFAGQGMCTGLRDAANLAWKIDHVLTQPGHDDLLDTYESERLPHARSIIEAASELGRVVCVTDATEAAARDAALRPTSEGGALTPLPPAPVLTAGLIDRESRGAGELFVQGVVGVGDEEGLCDDVFGIGWRLIVFSGVDIELPIDVDQWFTSIGSGIITFGGVDGVRDVDGLYQHWQRTHDVVALIQRPDFYVYGTAHTAEDVVPLLVRLRAALGGDVKDGE